MISVIFAYVRNLSTYVTLFFFSNFLFMAMFLQLLGLPITFFGTQVALCTFCFCNSVRKSSATILYTPLHVEFLRNVDYSDEHYPLSSASINPWCTYAKVKVQESKLTTHSQAYDLAVCIGLTLFLVLEGLQFSAYQIAVECPYQCQGEQLNGLHVAPMCVILEKASLLEVLDNLMLLLAAEQTALAAQDRAEKKQSPMPRQFLIKRLRSLTNKPWFTYLPNFSMMVLARRFSPMSRRAATTCSQEGSSVCWR